MARKTSIASSGAGEATQSTATVGSLFEPNAPELMSDTFVVNGAPIVVLAFNLPVGTEIRFEQVIYAPGEGETASGCCVKAGKDGAIVGVMPYKRCECEPKLSKHQVQCGTTPAGLPIWKTKEVARLVLPDAGVYRAVLNQPIGAGRVVFYEDANAHIDDKALGCCGGNEVNLNAIKTTTQPRYKVGQDFDYTIRLVNPGSAPANNANIKDSLPEEFILTGGITLTYGNGAAGPATLTKTQLANWNIPSFPATGYVDITARGHFDKEGAYLNKVCIYPPCGVNETSWGDNCAQVLLNIDPIKTKLVIDKTVSNANPLVGDTGSFTLTITNTGIDADANVVLTDVLPAGLAYAEPFAVTNSGAAGVPASVTAAQLAAGVVVASVFPVGATVTVQIPYTVTADVAGKTLTNTASAKGTLSEAQDSVALAVAPLPIIIPPDPIYKKCGGAPLTTSMEIITKGDYLGCDNLPLPCKPKLKQCCDTEVVVSSVSNRPAPAGVCLLVLPQEYEFLDSVTGAKFSAISLAAAQAINSNAIGGRAILQLRDKATLEGMLQLETGGNPGSVASATFTNPFECDALLEVDLYVHDNYSVGFTSFEDEALTYVHKIGTVLAEPFPILSQAGVNRTIGIHNLNATGGSVIGGGGIYNAETAWMGEYQAVVPAGGSVTVIAQTWAVFYANKNSSSGSFVVHPNKDLKERWTKGGKIA
jgi:uncharacterized repeat protein (TIGR01451 family)